MIMNQQTSIYLTIRKPTLPASKSFPDRKKVENKLACRVNKIERE